MTHTDLSGKVAVVTGASRGIGQAIGIRLGTLEASVVVNYARDTQGAAYAASPKSLAGPYRGPETAHDRQQGLRAARAERARR